MRIFRPPTRALALLCLAPLASGLAACASATSTSGFSGESKDVAQTIKDFQSDVTAADQKKICTHDLASRLVASLNTAKGGCEQALKNQLAEVDSVELTINSIALGGTSAARTATARVKSVYSGKSRFTTMSLVKQGGRWKIAGLG